MPSSSMLATFVAALESVGTVATLAGGGFYLHRRGFVSTEGKKVLARYSQQLAIPALFLSRLIGCGSNSSNAEQGASSLACCPSIWDQMSDLWILFVWPIYVIGVGLVVGSFACSVSNTPKWQRSSVTIAIACSNSFSLPITLLSVFEDSGIVPAVPGGNATSYLSMYVILQFVLMWGLGGYFLTPTDSDRAATASPAIIANYLKTEQTESGENTLLLSSGAPTQQQLESSTTSSGKKLTSGKHTLSSSTKIHQGIAILSKALQPPVVAAIVGLAIAGMPRIRFLLVEETPDQNAVPLAWLFRGLVSTGKSAVPVGMAVLGVNLSMVATYDSSEDPNPPTSSSSRVSPGTIVAAILSRMVLMPILGMGSVFLLSQLTGSSNMAAASTTNMASFYLVLMIVFITPTANSVLIMVELADGMREGIATILAWQYLLSPLILTCSITAVLHLAISI